MNAILLHFGMNMWDKQDTDLLMGEKSGYDTKLALEKEVWERVTNALPSCGIDTVLIDLGEGVKLDSHPELAIEGSWSKEDFRAELDRLRSIGLTPLPKFNFSCGHNAWMKDYAYMVGTKIYDQVCCDVVAETIELFDTPEFFHLGMEEENLGCQKKHPVKIIRSPEKKILDCKLLFDLCRAKGVRPWIWMDIDTLEAFGGEETFRREIPKDVLVSNWYYHEFPNPFIGGEVANAKYQARIKLYDKLGEWGYDQVPTSSTWCLPYNTLNTMEYCKEHATRVVGYMTAPWMKTTEDYYYGLMHDAYTFGVAKRKVFGK
ncbi:MAG: hypothetical protein IJP27_09825 [Clostridia bacterium]|nr:hypothetical protein [Clostridia bacterium]